jgi:hypothetical protein
VSIRIEDVQPVIGVGVDALHHVTVRVRMDTAKIDLATSAELALDAPELTVIIDHEIVSCGLGHGDRDVAAALL